MMENYFHLVTKGVAVLLVHYHRPTPCQIIVILCIVETGYHRVSSAVIDSNELQYAAPGMVVFILILSTAF